MTVAEVTVIKHRLTVKEKVKLIDVFIYLVGDISSTENGVDVHMSKAWNAINMLSIIWKSDLCDKTGNIPRCNCVRSWTQTKRLENKPGGNYKRILRAH